jgi:RarD protein
MIIITSVKKIKLPRGRALGASILMGAVGYASQSLLYFSALTVAPVSIVSLVLYLYPSLVTILSLLFLKEHLSLLKLIALILALGGMVLTVQPHGNGNIEGIFLSLLSAIIYSIYIVVGSRVTSYASTMAVSTIVIFSASVVYTIIVAINGVAFPHTTVGWLSILAIAIISTVFAIVAFFVGVEKIGPSNAAILSTIEPVVSVVLAGFLLGERISIVQLIGGSLILISSLLCSIEEGVS